MKNILSSIFILFALIFILPTTGNSDSSILGGSQDMIILDKSNGTTMSISLPMYYIGKEGTLVVPATISIFSNNVLLYEKTTVEKLFIIPSLNNSIIDEVAIRVGNFNRRIKY